MMRPTRLFSVCTSSVGKCYLLLHSLTIIHLFIHSHTPSPFSFISSSLSRSLFLISFHHPFPTVCPSACQSLRLARLFYPSAHPARPSVRRPSFCHFIRPVRPPVHLTVRLSCPSISPSVRPPVLLSPRPFIRPPVLLSVRPSIHRCLSLPVRPRGQLFICSPVRPLLPPSARPSVCQPRIRRDPRSSPRPTRKRKRLLLRKDRSDSKIGRIRRKANPTEPKARKEVESGFPCLTPCSTL